MTIDLEFNIRPGEDAYIMSGSEKIYHTKSEDILTANVFGHLKYINSLNWLKILINDHSEKDSTDFFEVHFWRKMPPPKNLEISEGSTQVDVILESSNTVIFVECKYKSKASDGTIGSNILGKRRNQIIRNIDVGLNYSFKRNKKFFFTYLTDNRDIPIEISRYKNDDNIVNDIKDYHIDKPEYLKKITSNHIKWITWEQIGDTIFNQLETLNFTEKIIAGDILKYLCLKKLYHNPICKGKNLCVKCTQKDISSTPTKNIIIENWSKERVFELMIKLNERQIRLMEILVEGKVDENGSERQEVILQKLGPLGRKGTPSSLQKIKVRINQKSVCGKILPDGYGSGKNRIHRIVPSAYEWVKDWVRKRKRNRGTEN